jgi:hypothetical protein
MKSENKLDHLYEKYHLLGIVKGNELLLPIDLALQFATELRAIYVRVLGVTGWRFVDQCKCDIVEDMRVDYYVGDEIYFGPNASEESINAVVSYLMNRIPKDVNFVTLDINSKDN